MREIRRLNALHRGITGPGYAARDPELSLWVHATLIDSTIAVADAWLEPVSPARRAAFYAETRPIGRAFGVPEALLPADLEAFDAYVAGMLGPSGPVRVSAVARELAGVVLRPPLAPLAPWLAGIPAPAYSWTLWPSVGLLPASVREDYGLAWGARERLVSAWLVAGWRALAAGAAAVVPPDAEGPRGGPADGGGAGRHRPRGPWRRALPVSATPSCAQFVTASPRGTGRHGNCARDRPCRGAIHAQRAQASPPRGPEQLAH